MSKARIFILERIKLSMGKHEFYRPLLVGKATVVNFWLVLAL